MRFVAILELIAFSGYHPSGSERLTTEKPGRKENGPLIKKYDGPLGSPPSIPTRSWISTDLGTIFRMENLLSFNYAALAIQNLRGDDKTQTLDLNRKRFETERKIFVLYPARVPYRMAVKAPLLP